jgi:clan AA aspartic protease (TIGR02281 family)
MEHLADIFIAFVVAISASLGLTRGLIRELLSLVAWLLAAALAFHTAPLVAGWLLGYVDDERLRFLVALALVFVPALLVFSLLAALLARIFLRGAPDSHDMLFGFLFGAVRGVVIVIIAVLVGRAAGLTQEQWWYTSGLIPRMEKLVDRAKPYLPGTVVAYIKRTERPHATRRLVLAPDPQGHYSAHGSVNGEPVDFLVDTGATRVTLSPDLADRLGLTPGTPMEIQTATGQTTNYDIMLDSVRIGGIELHRVKGAINPHTRDERVLLGMSFLRRLNFQQTGLGLILEQSRTIETDTDEPE